jgi:lysophospholipase L1-like esterase
MAQATYQPLVNNSAAAAQESRSRDELHDAQVRSAKADGCDVLFIGDSITSLWMRHPTWKVAAERYRGANFAVGGENTMNTLWRLRTLGEVDGVTPKVVVVLIGTNNLGMHDVEQTADGVLAVVAEVRRRAPAARVLLLGLLPKVVEAGDRRAKIRDINAILAKAVADDAQVAYRDIGATFLTPSGDLDKNLIGDGVHPTGKGYVVWWGAVEPLLKELMVAAPATAPAVEPLKE